MEIFQTTASPSQRIKEWNSVLNSTFGDIEFVTGDYSAFGARMLRRRVGPLTLASVDSTPGQVHGARGSTGAAIGHFLLFNEQGRSFVGQLGRETPLEPGELTVIEASIPYHILQGLPAESTAFRSSSCQAVFLSLTDRACSSKAPPAKDRLHIYRRASSRR